MNYSTLTGPCAEYEHDLVDLSDGALEPQREREVRRHLAGCARCAAWQASFAAIDARLSAALPSVELSADFDARLEQRLTGPVRTTVPRDLRSRLEQEHDSLVAALKRGARRQALLGATASVAAALCLGVAVQDLLLPGGELVPALGHGTQGLMALGGLGVAIALAALGWSASRLRLPLPGFGR
jgi:anti-sigma factor RsiW